MVLWQIGSNGLLLSATKKWGLFDLYSKTNPTLAKQEVFICEVTLGQIEVEGRMKYFAEWISKTLNETSPTFFSKLEIGGEDLPTLRPIPPV